MNSNLAKMIIKRILQSLLVIVIVTMIVFFLIHLIPGDPIVNFLGSNATEDQITYYTGLYGLDKPVVIQYFNWLAGIFRGNMGFSVSYQTEVQNIIFERLAITLNIVIPAFILAVIVGVTLGIIAALNRGKPVDTVVSFIANIGVAMPLFWIGIILILVFAVRLHLLPTSGYTAITEGAGEWIRHLILPIIVASFGALSTFTRQTRSSMLEVIRQDYVTTARSKGVSNKRIIFSHQLRNALIPLVTTMGQQFGMMVGGTVLIESVFAIPGLGNLMISSINSRDYFLVCGCIVILAVITALINLALDILYGVIDPRIRDN